MAAVGSRSWCWAASCAGSSTGPTAPSWSCRPAPSGRAPGRPAGPAESGTGGSRHGERQAEPARAEQDAPPADAVGPPGERQPTQRRPAQHREPDPELGARQPGLLRDGRPVGDVTEAAGNVPEGGDGPELTEARPECQQGHSHDRGIEPAPDPVLRPAGRSCGRGPAPPWDRLAHRWFTSTGKAGPQGRPARPIPGDARTRTAG
jgi:hypothetical protein